MSQDTNKRIRTEVVTGVAGDVVTALSPTTGKTGQVVYAQVVLTTDATAANRRLLFGVKDPDGNLLIDSHSGAVVVASATAQHHSCMQGVYRETAFIGDSIQIPIPYDMIVPNGGTVTVTIENGQAGDSYDVSFLGYEW